MCNLDMAGVLRKIAKHDTFRRLWRGKVGDLVETCFSPKLRVFRKQCFGTRGYPVANPLQPVRKDMGSGGPQPTSTCELSVSLLTLPLKFGTRSRRPVLTLQKQAPSGASSQVI